MGASAARRYDMDDDALEAIGPVPAHNGRRRSRRPVTGAEPVTTAGVPAARSARAAKPAANAGVLPAAATRGTAALKPSSAAVVASTAPLRVAPPTPVSSPRAPFVFGVVLLVVMGIVGLMVLNTKINENSFRLHDLRKQQASLDSQEQQLKEDLVWRTAPGNLAAAARRLGLVPAGTPAFIRLPDGRVLGVPKPARSAVPPTSPSGPSSPGQATGDGTGQQPPNGR